MRFLFSIVSSMLMFSDQAWSYVGSNCPGTKQKYRSYELQHSYNDDGGQTNCKTCPDGWIGNSRTQRGNTKCIAPLPHQYLRSYYYGSWLSIKSYLRFFTCVHYKDEITRAILAKKTETKNKASWAGLVHDNIYIENSAGVVKSTNDEIQTRAFCLECPPGAYGTATQYTSWYGQAEYWGGCRYCFPGRYSDDNHWTDRPYHWRSYKKPRARRRDCANCPVGYSQWSSGKSSCLMCSTGTYASSEGQPTCSFPGDVTYHGKKFWFWTDGKGAVQDDHCIKRPTRGGFGAPGEPMCDNGGICNPDQQGFKCTCMSGYEGITCQREVNYCGTYMFVADYQMCSSRVTPPGGTGRVSSSDQYYDENAEQECANRCRAMNIGTGFTVIGSSCQCSVDDCSTRVNSISSYSFRFIQNYDGPCKHGTCSSYDGGYDCVCEAGWSGKQCDKWIGNLANVQVIAP